ncbi:complement decay-accelerating factor-like [Ruditapes philippinarum]|uniref:complement decay-accelerating factor-like n=1 Tax=Ruditapes philippinarum TaxID=129788 RepID=UPI00295A8F7D|nr:complement decay-accelerating factor-like [Ruditapes philippinarum]
MADKQRSYNEIMIEILIAAIAWAVLVSGQVTRIPFPCHSDVCNLYGQDQFCSERESKCRDCLDIIDGCFEHGMPSNCTRTCIEFHVQEKMKNERESACPNLDPIENGKSNGSTSEIYKPGDVVGITCDAGYRLSGRPTLKCKSYGQWSHDVPTCEEITCPVLQGVSNGNHNGSETIPHQPGDIIIFQCNPGYQRIGAESTTCKTDGTWQDKMPICQIYPEFPPIMNGKWNQSGLVLHATCDSGYILVGSEFLRWSETGSWVSSDGHLPYCKEEEITVTVWMIIGIIGLVESVCMCCYIVYRCYMNVYTRKNKDSKIVKECGNKEEMADLMEAGKQPQSENTFPTSAVSLHEQKYQKEATSISNGIKKDDRAPKVTRSKGIAPSSTDHFSSQTHDANISIDPPDMPSWSNSVPKDHRVLQDVQKKKQEAASENNIPSNTHLSCSGKHDDKSNHVKIDINIHNNSSAHNKSVVDSGRDATHSESTNTTAPSTTDGTNADKEDGHLNCR